MSVVGKATNLASDWGKKILSNLSIDKGAAGFVEGGIERTRRKILQNADNVAKSGVDVSSVTKIADDIGSIPSIKGQSKAMVDEFVGAFDGQGVKPGALKSGLALNSAQEYFMGGNKAQKITRIGAAAGAYAGVNVGGRMLSGGSATRNPNGERDIAGIPII